MRLSDALNRAALDHTQDSFFIDLQNLAELPATENVGDLLLFAAELVGNDRLRPDHLTISAGRPNDRLWQCKTHSHVASLKLTQEVTAFSLLNSFEHCSPLTGIVATAAGEGVHFAMVAIHCLPEGVASDEHRELRDAHVPGLCRLPHEELAKEEIAKEQRQLAGGTAQAGSKRHNLAIRVAPAPSSAPAMKASEGRGGRNKTVSFQ